MSDRKHPHAKSDRLSGRTQSLKVGSGHLRAYTPYDWTPDGKKLMRERVRLKNGREIYTTASRLCACGKPALRVWHDVGYCKAHTPARV